MLICQLTCCSSWAMLNEQLNQRASNLEALIELITQEGRILSS